MSDDDSRALLVLKPDAVLQRLTAPVLDWLAARGYRPIRYREFMLTPELRQQLYATTRQGGKLDWELNAILYTLAPVRALLLDGSGHAGEASAAEQLSSVLKGPFRPNMASPGTIRRDVGALNPICNLVHAADDPAEVERETAVLFDAPSMAGELTALGQAAAERPAPTPLWSTLALVLDAQVDDKAWPSDADGPATHALRLARSTLDQLSRHELMGDIIRGARTGAIDYHAWAGHLPDTPGAWETYLTYTTVRYLELCLESADVT